MRMLPVALGFLAQGLLVSALVLAPGNPLEAQTAHREGEARLMAEDEARELERWATRRLQELEANRESGPATLERETERLWALYLVSVGKKRRVEEAETLVVALRERAEEAGLSTTPYEALEAAVEVVKAKHARWPPSKLSHLRSGLGSLDRLVASDPDNLQVRYLRLMSCFYLPFFLKREDSVAEDMGVLISRLPHHPSAFSPVLYRGVALFLLENAEMTPEARMHLEEALG